MKPFLRFALFLPLALAAATLRAEDKPADKIPPGALKTFDLDKDGALDATEHAAWQTHRAEAAKKKAQIRAEQLAAFDLDQDGKLNEEEKAAAKLANEKARAERNAAKAAKKEKKEKDKDAATSPAEPAPAESSPEAAPMMTE